MFIEYLATLPGKFVTVLASFAVSIGFLPQSTPVEPMLVAPPPVAVVASTTTIPVTLPKPAVSTTSTSTVPIVSTAKPTTKASTTTPSQSEKDILNALKNAPTINAGVVPLNPVIAQIIESDPESPLIATLMPPKLIEGQKDYKIYLWDGNSYKFHRNLAPLETMTFPNGGVSRFKIEIDPAARLTCNGAFFKQVTFDSPGLFKGKTYRITTSLDHPICGE